ncbi:MAG TPA: hypothetical protein VM534_01770, partial [Thermoanaerobaculia bacterium]|nr:hypothetical protein [Thermoanaerobaculia bacterium]
MVETTGKQVTVRFDLRDAVGALRGSWTYTLLPWEQRLYQLRDLAPGLVLEDGTLVVEILDSEGRLVVAG